MSVVRLAVTSIAVVIVLSVWQARAESPPRTISLSEAATAEYRRYLETLTKHKGRSFVNAALAVSINGEVTYGLLCDGGICLEVDISIGVLKGCQPKAQSECVVAMKGDNMIVSLIPYQN